MTPEKLIPNLSDPGSFPWYLALLAGAAAKLEAVPMKLLVGILITLIGGFGTFTAYRASSWADRMEIKLERVYKMMGHKAEVDNFQMTCINELRQKQGMKPIIIPRLGGDDFGDK